MSLKIVLVYWRGVCQDFVYLGIVCVCFMGLVVGYVSGYLEMLLLFGEKKMEGVDVFYVWFLVYMFEYGWVQFDFINNIFFFV